jgi:hypothetical protein
VEAFRQILDLLALKELVLVALADKDRRRKVESWAQRYETATV